MELLTPECFNQRRKLFELEAVVDSGEINLWVVEERLIAAICVLLGDEDSAEVTSHLPAREGSILGE